MDVVALLIFTLIFGVWGFWVAGRGETRPRKPEGSGNPDVRGTSADGLAAEKR